MQSKYDHLTVEQDKNQKWISKKYFIKRDLTKEPYAILMPPPNVTGKLHLGHAWDGMIQDTLIRYHYLKGYDVIWIPGIDHAGIATQAKVEARLREQNINRFELGRPKFIEQVWAWKKEYTNSIRSQWAKLGFAIDYTQEKFTLDKNVAQAVSDIFIKLYERKLIYRGQKAINWDPKLRTVISNIEVDNIETKQKMYYINYDLVEGGFITIATVRPETLFADVAVAINPQHPSLKRYIGKKAIHPLTKRIMPIIGESSIELNKGSGAMKVSAHSQLDFELLKKHNLEVIECIDKMGKLNSQAGEFANLDRFEAREKIIAKLGKRVIKVEETISAIGHSQRSGAVVEVLVQPQWFVKMKPLAQKVLKNLESEEAVSFKPMRFKQTLKQWMENIEDWCISRQLWWGHQIPAWYYDGEIKVQHQSPGKNWKQDEDVLDTWFSSGLAPLTFLDWPKSSQNLKRFYPSSVLVTAYDIIFFWVARMYFQSLDITNKIPFKEVLIHGLIRDNQGRKMSKSLGNGIDPMTIVDQYGADALHWFLLTNSTPGQDLRFSEAKIKAAWNLNNKIWNISRYIYQNMSEETNDLSAIDHWIGYRLKRLINLIESHMINYDFTIIAKEINKFINDDFSSWYLEMAKEIPNQIFAKKIWSQLLIAIHPFIPFLSDHLYLLLNNKELLEQQWVNLEFEECSSIDQIIALVKLVRNFRAQRQIEQQKKLILSLDYPLNEQEEIIFKKMANVDISENEGILVPFHNYQMKIKLPDGVILAQKQAKLKKIAFLEKEIKRSQAILNNQQFMLKANSNKIAQEQAKYAKYQSEYDALVKEKN